MRFLKYNVIDDNEVERLTWEDSMEEEYKDCQDFRTGE